MKISIRVSGLLLLLLPSLATADDLDPVAVHTVWLMAAAALVFLMQAGFALLESGMARSKNTVNVFMKNLLDLCFGSILFWSVGYGLMFGVNNSGLVGESHFFPDSMDPFGYSFLLFQLMFAATAATIASGAMAERTRLGGYVVVATAITAVIYPVFGSWVWGGWHGGEGWLAELGFIDFAGSTVVHSTGAWCALAGILVVGPRLGRFPRNKGAHAIPGHNLGFVALGGLLLWLGWFGFNGGSTLAAEVGIGRINLNTQLAAAAGAVGAILINRLMGRPMLLTQVVNGLLGGLVGITAGCATMTPPFALTTGLVAGFIVVLGGGLLQRLRLDDVVGAIPVHGFCGIWGTIAAGLFFEESMFDPDRIIVQLIGVGACILWVFPTSLTLYWLVSRTMGLRSESLHEQRGLDITEHAEIGYPEFSRQTAYDTEVLSRLDR